MTNALLRLRLDIAYDGTEFHGWAAQKDPALRTVQATIEEKLSLVLRHEVELTVAGRTDAGVHARGQVAHVDVPSASLNQRSIDGDPRRLVRRLARLLPDDIRISHIDEAPPGFDARFSALRRRYVYRVTTDPAGPLPTRRSDTAQWIHPVDLDRMQHAAQQLVGLHDFAAFCKAREHATTIRHLQEFQWRDVSTPEEPQVYEATVVADAFCWNMVRSLVGACLIIGEGKRDVSLAAVLLDEAERSSIIPVAPAKGLTMTGVDYPADHLLAERALETQATRTRSEVQE